LANEDVSVKKEIVSFGIRPHVKAELQKIPGYTRFIEALVEKHLGHCPLCSQKLKKKPRGGKRVKHQE